MPKKITIFAVMKKLLYMCAVAAVVMSCAKTPDFPINEVALVSFKQWMAINAPKAEMLSEDKSGAIYIEYIHKAEPMHDSLIVKEDMWFNMSYVGRRLDQTVFVTRDSTVSKNIKQWVNTTHWVYDFRQYKEGYTISLGFDKLLPKLNTGDHVRVYFSTTNAFQASVMSVNDGYKGETTEYVGYPCYMDIKMGTTLSNPTAAQMDSVKNYAKTKWAQEIKDTVLKDVFMKKLVENPKGDSIGQDSTVNVWYRQNFLDGFLIKTNNDSIAKIYGRSPENGSSSILSFSANTEGNEVPAIFLKAIKKMRRGETAQFLVTSENSAQGALGDFTAKPQVMSYTPTIYTLEILTKEQLKHYNRKK